MKLHKLLKKASYLVLIPVGSLLFNVELIRAETGKSLKLPAPQIEKLSNGLEVAWFESNHLPLVDLVLVVKSGFRDDPVGKSGTAELVSNLLDRGAAGMKASQIAQEIESLGASHFSAAEDDVFNLGMHGLASDAPVLLDLLSKIAMHPDFPISEVQREHARLVDRWNHIADSSETLVTLTFRRLLTQGTSYGRGGFHSIEEFEKVGREDAVAFHQKYFVPENSVLMVVGQVDRQVFKQKILSTFGTWQSGPKGALSSRSQQNFIDRRLPNLAVAKRGGKSVPSGAWVVVDRPGNTQAQVRIGFRAPLLKSPEHYPLVVANAMLGEYFNSRLNSLIRDKLGLTYSIGSGLSYSRELGILSISSATKNESVGQLIRKTFEVLRTFKRGPIPAEELQMAKEYLIGGFPLGTATLGAVASRWLGGYVFEMGPDYLNEFIPSIEKITSADVVSAVDKSFDLDNSVIVISGDAAAIRKSLEQERKAYKDLKWGTVRQVEASDLL